MHNETFETSKNIEDIKLAILSDIHYYPGYNLKILDKLYNQIKDNNPNYICIVGDILDESSFVDINPLLNWFNKLAVIAPVMVVYGNHDIKSGRHKHWKYQKNTLIDQELSKNENIHILSDTIFKENNIAFYGYNLSFEMYEIDKECYESFKNEVSKLETKLDANNYNVILTHSPFNIYNYVKEYKNSELAKGDLFLFGHCHNGCIPFFITHIFNKIFKSTRGLVSPRRKIWQKYIQGRVYEQPDGYIYDGVCKLSHCMGWLHKFDFLYAKNVTFLSIKKK